MANSIVAKGNVTRVEEVKFSPSGSAVLSFGLADNTGFGDKKVVTFWRVSVFGKQAENMAKILAKGMEITVIGEACNRPYQKDGVEKFSLDIRATDIWLGKKQEGKPEAPLELPSDDVPW